MMRHVAVALISRIKDNQTEYLLVKSKKDYGQYFGYWFNPGGHVEDGEEHRETVVRELKEELGLDIDPIEEVSQMPGDVPNQITHWWRCELLSDSMRIETSEIAEADWFTEERMNDLPIWPATRKFFEIYVFEGK